MDINSVLNTLNIEISYINGRQNNNNNIISFSFKVIHGNYAIYISPQFSKDIFDILDTIEKGHILYNHLVHQTEQKDIFYKYLNNNTSDFFSRLPEDKNINQKIPMYANYLFERFSGMAKAMEINSKLFPNNWEQIRLLLDSSIPNSILRRNEYLEFPHSGWPLALDWTSYLILLCKNFKTSLNAISANNGDGNCNNNGRKILNSDISTYKNEKKFQEIINENTILQQTIVEKAINSGDMSVKKGRTSSLSGASSSYSVYECDTLNGLLAILKEKSIIEKKRKIKTDLMYNINRNKISNDIIIPRRYQTEKKLQSNICILLDVSGSIPVGFIGALVKTIIKSQGVFNKKNSRLVCWSDSLCSDTMLDKLQNVRAGGSTILSGGIEYCKKYLNDYSSFFIVSDFQDDLEEWIKHAKNIKAKKTAVAYANIANKISFSHWFSMIGSNSNSHRAVTGIKEFSAVFDTVLIRSGSP